jgi:hypothetical protein
MDSEDQKKSILELKSLTSSLQLEIKEKCNMKDVTSVSE